VTAWCRASSNSPHKRQILPPPKICLLWGKENHEANKIFKGWKPNRCNLCYSDYV